MADRVLFIGWGTPVRGREERGLEVFNESVGLYGRMQQEGRIEKFDVILLGSTLGLNGYIELHGSAEQLNAVRESEDFRRSLADASLIVDDIHVVDGFANEGVSWRDGDLPGKHRAGSTDRAAGHNVGASMRRRRASSKVRPSCGSCWGCGSALERSADSRTHQVDSFAGRRRRGAPDCGHERTMLAWRCLRPHRRDRAGVGALLGAVPSSGRAGGVSLRERELRCVQLSSRRDRDLHARAVRPRGPAQRERLDAGVPPTRLTVARAVTHPAARPGNLCVLGRSRRIGPSLENR